jgi:tetratricopeptide (TPR) repeat protein
MNSRIRKLLTASFVLGCALSLIAPAYSADKWLSIKTRHFTVIGNGSEADLRRTATHLEELRSAFTALFPRIQQVSTTSTVVFVFKNDDSLKAYKPLVDGKPANVSGFFVPGTDVHYMAVTGSMANQASVVHDYLHSLIRDASSTLPFWTSEGLAEHYSTFEAGSKEGEFSIGRAPARHTRVLGETFMPLDKLFAIDHTSPEYNEKTKQGVFYAESWALMHYLSLGADGKRQPQLVKFLQLLEQEKPLRESFAEAFQTDLAALEKELRDYVRLKTLPSTKTTAKAGGLADKSMAATTLSEAQAQYQLGDLLLHIDRIAEAEAHLKTALSLDPKLSGPLGSLAMAGMKKKQYTDAVTYARRAADTDTQNYLAHFYYSQILQTITKSGESVITVDESTRYDSMRQHLHRAIDLAPNFVEAYGLLALVNMEEGENLKEAETLLRKALTIAPGRHDLSLMLAETMLRTDQTAAARTLLSTLGRVSTDPIVRSRSLNLVEQLDLKDSFYKELTGGTDKPVPAPAPAAAAATPARTEVPQAPRTVPPREEPKLESLTPAVPEVEGEKVTGLLVMLECTSGLTLRIQAANRMIELHSANPEQIQFLSYTSAVSDNIKCGPRNPGTPVKVTYRSVRGGTPASVGEPLVVEFLEK